MSMDIKTKIEYTYEFICKYKFGYIFNTANKVDIYNLHFREVKVPPITRYKKII